MSLFAAHNPAVNVSVIIPVYRPTTYLRGTLASIFQENPVGLEVVVVDDGSPEDVPAACGPYLSRVRIVRQPNSERSIARNNGMSHASGAFIHFLDADDQVSDGFYARCASALKQHPQWDAVVVPVASIDADNRPTCASNRTRFRGLASPEIAYAMPIPPVSYMFRRECIDRAGGFDSALPPVRGLGFMDPHRPHRRPFPEPVAGPCPIPRACWQHQQTSS